MCGIIGAVSQQDVVNLLLNGLKHLEYRGYDSSGLATIDLTQGLCYQRVAGKHTDLIEHLKQQPLSGNIGIAHTRWATHGKATEKNAHPQCVHQAVAVVHNGIIENYLNLKTNLNKQGIRFQSETDTEVIPWLIYQQLKTEKNLLKALQNIISHLEGSFAIVLISPHDPHRLIATRKNSPLIIGLGKQGNYIASDPLPLSMLTDQFIYLEEGDTVALTTEQVTIYDRAGREKNRSVHTNILQQVPVNKGAYSHYLKKEIEEQPKVAQTILTHYLRGPTISLESLGLQLPPIQHIHLSGCGSSYHAASIGRFWIEQLAGIPCLTDIASELRYRNTPIPPHTLLITLSQSGETADTLELLRNSQKYQTTLGICNYPHSSLAREAAWVLLTYAGQEMSVAATKSFTAQLQTLLILALALAESTQHNPARYHTLVKALPVLPQFLKKSLEIEQHIIPIASQWAQAAHVLLIARDIYYPIACEGSLKLKEIAYLPTETHPAGELKHGPLALINENLPLMILAPDDHLVTKLESTAQEILARGGQLTVIAGNAFQINSNKALQIIRIPYHLPSDLYPLIYTLPLQYLAYHVARLRKVNIDQPRHLAKSVTVE